MTARVWPVDAVSVNSVLVPSYVGRALRQLESSLIAGSTAARPLGARTGVTPGIPASSVTATSTTWTVKPISGVMDVQTSAIAGPYRFVFDADTSGPINSPDANNPRVDIIYVQVSDSAESDGTPTTTPGSVKVDYLAGTAAATPSAPATPVRSFVIARINVPASGQGAPSVSWVAPYTTSAGGIIPTSGPAQYPTSPYVGQYIDDASLGLLRWDGTTWQPFGKGGGDTGWQTCGPGNGNVTGTAKVRRIGNQVFGQLNLAYAGGWPTSPITAFSLPATSYAPGAAHRMSMGGPIQATPGTIILSASPGANAVFGGSNGGAGNSGLTWNSLLWLVD